MTQAERLKFYLQELKRSKNWRASQSTNYDSAWKRYIDLYQGKYLEGAPTTDQLVVNMVFSTINVMAPAVAINNPRFTINARNPESAAQAIITEEVLNWLWRTYGYQREFRLSILDWLLIGHGWLKIGYKWTKPPETKKADVTDANSADEDGGDEGIDDREDMEGNVESEMNQWDEDRPFVERISVFDMFVDPDARHPKEMRWIAQRTSPLKGAVLGPCPADRSRLAAVDREEEVPDPLRTVDRLRHPLPVRRNHAASDVGQVGTDWARLPGRQILYESSKALTRPSAVEQHTAAVRKERTVGRMVLLDRAARESERFSRACRHDDQLRLRPVAPNRQHPCRIGGQRDRRTFAESDGQARSVHRLQKDRHLSTNGFTSLGKEQLLTIGRQPDGSRSVEPRERLGGVLVRRLGHRHDARRGLDEQHRAVPADVVKLYASWYLHHQTLAAIERDRVQPSHAAGLRTAEPEFIAGWRPRQPGNRRPGLQRARGSVTFGDNDVNGRIGRDVCFRTQHGNATTGRIDSRQAQEASFVDDPSHRKFEAMAVVSTPDDGELSGRRPIREPDVCLQLTRCASGHGSPGKRATEAAQEMHIHATSERERDLVGRRDREQHAVRPSEGSRFGAVDPAGEHFRPPAVPRGGVDDARAVGGKPRRLHDAAPERQLSKCRRRGDLTALRCRCELSSQEESRETDDAYHRRGPQIAEPPAG